MGVESAKKYNKRIENAIQSFTAYGNSVAIIGKGRNLQEQSLVLIEHGAYFGYGFFDREAAISDLDAAKNFVRKSVETPTVQNLINSYLMNPRGSQVVTFQS